MRYVFGGLVLLLMLPATIVGYVAMMLWRGLQVGARGFDDSITYFRG